MKGGTLPKKFAITINKVATSTSLVGFQDTGYCRNKFHVAASLRQHASQVKA
jgi:hypothetical protein